MPWTSLRINPGIVRNGTRYSAAGTWYDCSLVRFRDGFPERWSGWTNAYPEFAGMNGHCRSLHRHGALDATIWVSAGTSRKFYVLSSDLQYDVTPYDTASLPSGILLAANPLTTTAGSKDVKVTHTLHNAFVGNYVEISGVAAAIGGIPAADFIKEHLITGWIDENNYIITVATTATSTVSGGGAAVRAKYILAIGADDAVSHGGGWGQDVWGHEFGWGLSRGGMGADRLGIWTQDNWGEDLVANPQGGAIYFWKASTPSVRMIDINTLPPDYLGPGSPAAVPLHIPDVAEFIIVSHRDRHLLAFGASIYMGGGAVGPMVVRWCSQENILNWDNADTTGTAGDLPLSNGSRFISAIATTREIIVWSDQAMYSLQYVGAPLIYVADILERWSDIVGLKARCSFNGVVYWMGSGGFYAYTGRVEKIPCTIWDHIVVHINEEQISKVYASSNQKYNEVIFFYPSVESIEIDSYVAFDTVQQLWTMGSLARTAWMDIDAASPAIGAEPGPTIARLFEHDRGSDDGSTEPPSPLNAFIEGGPIELSSEGSFDKGDKMMFVRKIMPDVTFRDIETSVTAPQMNIVLKMQDEPGSTWMDASSSQVQRSARIPIEQFTRRVSVRLRGRSLTLRAESDTLGSEWRLGITRIDARTDGQKV